jgi:hypothetical protein
VLEQQNKEYEVTKRIGEDGQNKHTHLPAKQIHFKNYYCKQKNMHLMGTR